MKEPRWRTVLCWGAVLTFFSVPMVGLGILVMADYWPNIRNHLAEYKFIGPFFQSVTALVFGLAGLNTTEKYFTEKNGKPPRKTPE
jgi:ABC-type Fe3+ transport system permease subunit